MDNITFEQFNNLKKDKSFLIDEKKFDEISKEVLTDLNLFTYKNITNGVKKEETIKCVLNKIVDLIILYSTKKNTVNFNFERLNIYNSLTDCCVNILNCSDSFKIYKRAYDFEKERFFGNNAKNIKSNGNGCGC